MALTTRWRNGWLPDRKIHKGIAGQDLHTGTSQPSKLPLKKRLDAFQQHVDKLKETIRKGKEKGIEKKQEDFTSSIGNSFAIFKRKMYLP